MIFFYNNLILLNTADQLAGKMDFDKMRWYLRLNPWSPHLPAHLKAHLAGQKGSQKRACKPAHPARVEYQYI